MKSVLSSILVLGFLLSCSGSSPIDPIPKKSARTTSVAPSNLSGWWRFQSYVKDAYPFPVTQNYSDYRSGCSTSTRWLYISPTNGNIYTSDGNGCYPGSLAAINSGSYYLVEYFIWGTFSGETPTYSFQSTGATTGYFDVHRGSYYTNVYTQSTVFNSGLNLQICPNNTGECHYWRRPNAGESTPSLP